MKRPDPLKGLTLLEIMIAMALVAMAGVMAVPGLMKLGALVSVNAAVRGVASDMQAARFRAVADHINVVLFFEPEANRYGTCHDLDRDGCGEGDPLKWIDLGGEYRGVRFGSAGNVMRTSYGSWVGPAGVHFRDWKVVMRPDGRPDRSGSLYMIPAEDVPQRKDRMRAVSALLTTGRIRTWRYDEASSNSAQGRGPWRPFF